MKKQIRIQLISLALVVCTLLCFTSCTKSVNAEGVWENATYLKDKSFGKGQTTIEVEVQAGEQSVTFTISTDDEILGDVLLEHELIDGEESQYGLYVKEVNGMVADYDQNGAWWGFYKDGELMPVGVDSTTIADGDHYELVYETN